MSLSVPRAEQSAYTPWETLAPDAAKCGTNSWKHYEIVRIRDGQLIWCNSVNFIFNHQQSSWNLMFRNRIFWIFIIINFKNINSWNYSQQFEGPMNTMNGVCWIASVIQFMTLFAQRRRRVLLGIWETETRCLQTTPSYARLHLPHINILNINFWNPQKKCPFGQTN